MVLPGHGRTRRRGGHAIRMGVVLAPFAGPIMTPAKLLANFGRANSQSRFSSNRVGFLVCTHDFGSPAATAVAHLHPFGRLARVNL